PHVPLIPYTTLFRSPGGDETAIDFACPCTLRAAGCKTAVDLERNLGGRRIHPSEAEIAVAARNRVDVRRDIPPGSSAFRTRSVRGCWSRRHIPSPAMEAEAVAREDEGLEARILRSRISPFPLVARDGRRIDRGPLPVVDAPIKIILHKPKPLGGGEGACHRPTLRARLRARGHGAQKRDDARVAVGPT